METGEGGQTLALKQEQVADDDSETSYTYDPLDPVPTLWSRDLYSVPGNRRRLDYRRDILRYRTAPLIESCEIGGDATVVLFVSCTTPDTRFFARLVDEPPKARPWKSPTDGAGKVPAFLRAGGLPRRRRDHGNRNRPRPYRQSFLPGHRIRLEITSSDFPGHDRNHNTGVDDLFDAELQAAQITVHHGPETPSRVLLPVRA